jgi:hypothetical protein
MESSGTNLILVRVVQCNAVMQEGHSDRCSTQLTVNTMRRLKEDAKYPANFINTFHAFNTNLELVRF